MLTTFDQLIAKNKRVSNLLIASLAAFLALMVGALAFGYTNSAGFAVSAALLALALSSGGGIYALKSGGDAVVSALSATPLSRNQDPELFNVVEEMAIAAGLPVPQIVLINDDAMNAFAAGTSSKNAVIGITEGLRQKLSRDELQGVIAHEMSHIANLDVRLMTVVAVYVGFAVFLSDILLRSRRVRSNSSSSNGGGRHPAAAILLVIGLICAIIAPILTRLLQLCISREREYLADATAVQLTRNPLGLMSALEKLTRSSDDLEVANRATEHLFIVSPNTKMRLNTPNLDSVWCTHPPLDKRLARLRQLIA